MMHSVAAELLSMTEDNFESESFGSKLWQKSRRAAADNGKTLQDSGQLAASITAQSGKGFACVGSNKPYAAVHHLGGRAGRGKTLVLPARPYLPIDGEGKLQQDGEKRLSEILKDALSKGV